jgi:hypothetical protein
VHWCCRIRRRARGVCCASRPRAASGFQNGFAFFFVLDHAPGWLRAPRPLLLSLAGHAVCDPSPLGTGPSLALFNPNGSVCLVQKQNQEQDSVHARE